MEVLCAEVEHAVTGLPVAACSSDLLRVAFKASGNVVVDNISDVGLVDAHTECNRCTDDHVPWSLSAVCQLAAGTAVMCLLGLHELILNRGLLFGRHTGMKVATAGQHLVSVGSLLRSHFQGNRRSDNFRRGK